MNLIALQSISGSINGTSWDLERYPTFAIQFVWTGTPTGTVLLQSSNDGTNWGTVANSSQATAGAAGSHMVSYDGSGFRYVRPIYTHTSGSGTLLATGWAKSK